MAKRRFCHGSPTTELADPLTRLWILRLLVPLEAQRNFIRSHDFRNDAVAVAVGLSAWVDPVDREFEAAPARAELKRLHACAEKAAKATALPEVLSRNLERLAAWVGLSDIEVQILAFAVLIHNDPLLNGASDMLGDLSSPKIPHVLAVLLALPESQVRSALASKGLLARSGLVSLDRSGALCLSGKLDLISPAFADHLLTETDDPLSLLKDVVLMGGKAELALADFGHVQETLDVLRPYLAHALESHRRGVNVLIYGEPGTGKSQLTRALAADAGCDLFEIASEDGDGDAVAGERRLRAFRAAQCFFGTRRALILFDETEDVFNDGDGIFGRRSTAQRRKAWMNRALEENPVPALWLSNSADCLDPAFVRRFDIVMELPVPPRRDRERIFSAACGDLVDAASLARLAAADSLSPAVIARAASVVKCVRQHLPPGRTAQAVEHLVERTLQAQGHPSLGDLDGVRLPDHYDPRYVNVDADLEAIAAGLAKSGSGRLCLFGPPGTGKSAFGRWVADRLGSPLDVRRVSDIVSPYVGMTEKNLSRAFREARRAGAVLLLDEVDSFLQDRRSAQRTWEVTEVNEMLTQMEAFDGVFIATTNLMDDLDQAALRRFDLKLRFGYLQPKQARRLFEVQCRALGMGEPPARAFEALGGLDTLTPGDFAAAARQHRFRPLAGPEELVNALAGECELKHDGAKKVIGFR